jgi:hypothetical protein
MGEDFESDAELFARVDRLLGVRDETVAAGFDLAREEVYTLLFMPWVERLLIGAEGDIPKMLKDAILGARFQANVPRTLQANVAQVLVIAEHMLGALRTGRMKWALKRRPHFDQASRVCVMVEKGCPPEPGESFDDLYRKAFPAGPGSRGRRGRGRRG